jgi:hypothetical protein
MKIEINGIEYQKIEKQPRKNSKTMSKLLMMAAMFGSLNGIGRKTRNRPDVILEQEYGLIQEKKSKLSRNDRDWVVSQFERKYKRID